MPITEALLEATFVLWGLLIGSFLNVCIHRVPLRQSIVSPRSRCPDCGYQLSWQDNVPVLSYALLRGRCRSCAQPISLRYPIVEIVTGLVFFLHWQVFGPTPLLLVRVAFACALIVHFMIDLEHQILPDVINLPGIAIGFACSLFLPPGPLLSALGILVGGGLLWAIAEIWLRLRKVDAMGFGDVKMLAMIGAFLGVKMVVLTFVLSSLVGGIVGGILIASRRGGLATRVPFGTMLAAAALVASLYGERLLAWYLSLMRV
jgi:leader peptidase (prepilin peptidase) / N-methyltransferase